MNRLIAIMMACACTGILTGELYAVEKETTMFSNYLIGLNLPDELSRLECSGKLTEAMSWIDTHASGTLFEEKERLRRLKLEYNLSPEEMLAKIRKDLPDATAEDLSRWTKSGQIMMEPVDGQMRYFRREPGNLWRRSDEARQRRDALTPARQTLVADPASQARAARMANVADAVAGTTAPMRFQVTHEIHIPSGKIPAGETVSCWIPLPQKYAMQSEPKNLSTTPQAKSVTPSGENMRTVYMEQPAKASEPTVFRATYEYSTSAFYVPSLDANQVKIDPKDPVVKKYTQPVEPHILINKETVALAREIVGDETNPLRQAERIWHWMQNHIKYEAEMNYAVIPSCTRKIMATRSGDCGIQALMFISLCRSLGIPARWQSGWVTTPNYWNMHDWAEIYMPPFGWLPVDPSIGYLDSKDSKVKNFLFAGLDVYRMIANLDCAVAFTPKEKYFRSDPVDNQVGEVQWKDGNLYNNEWEYSVEVQRIR